MWTAGFALDLHTTGSTYLGDDHGHAQFETSRSPVGELLYRLKYRGDEDTVQPIVDTVVEFFETWKPPIDAIVPVPPSNPARRNQPVLALATALSTALGVPLCTDCISKVKTTPQLKDVSDYHKRIEVLKDAFAVDRRQTEGKNLLVFDDLYRSGATVTAIARLLMDGGAAKAVYLLTLTETRRIS